MSASKSVFDLRAIRDRANAATPGPWCYGYTHDIEDVEDVANIEETRHLYDQQGDLVAAAFASDDEGDYGPQTLADVRFISCARDDVPALCDEIERLRAERVAHNEVCRGEF